MTTDGPVARREATPDLPVPAGATTSSLPQKRALDDDHVPMVSSPLNPNMDPRPTGRTTQQDEAPAGREKRTKKETLKKRESKGVAGDSSGRGTPEPRRGAGARPQPPPSEASPLRYKLAPPKPGDFEPARGPVFTHHHDVEGLNEQTIAFHETSEHVYNKKNYHYTHCIADPAFPSSFYYRQTEPEPHGPHISFEDAATHMFLDQSGRHITTDKGFRMARANVAVRQGRWYWECRVTRGTVRGGGDAAGGESSSSAAPTSHGHVRVGFARREASLDAPVGFDAYSYGIRDVEGQKMHMSRPKDFFPPGEEVLEGDVIGLEIQLPSEALHRKVVRGEYNPAVDGTDDESTAAAASAEGANIVRDRIPIRFKAHIYFEKIDYHTTKELEDLMNPSPSGSTGSSGSAEPPGPTHPTPALRTLPGSFIRVYRNGVLMGTAFRDLLAFLPPASRPQTQVGAREGMDDGMLGYYPAISVFRGGAAEVNFGPAFWFPPPGYGEAAKEEQGDVEMGGASDTAGAATDTVMVADTVVAASGPRPVGRLQPLSERYAEQIAEDVVADIVDEVDFWMQDGARVIDRTGGRDQKADVTVGIAPGREEIKELVQDD